MSWRNGLIWQDLVERELQKLKKTLDEDEWFQDVVNAIFVECGPSLSKPF